MRLARMWNSRSPGVETAWRAPARISRNGCSSAGRGGPEEAIPGLRPETHHAGKSRFQVAKFHRAHQLGDVSAERAQSGNIIRVWLERHDQEHRSARERRGDSLRDVRQFSRGFKRTHGIEIGIVLHRALLSSKWRRSSSLFEMLRSPRV